MPGRAFTLDELKGAYHIGTGLGFNWTLELAGDGSFTASCFGCRGDLGGMSGSWGIDGERLWLRTDEGEVREPPVLSQLRIRVHETRFVLVPECWRQSIAADGLQRWTCLHPLDLELP